MNIGIFSSTYLPKVGGIQFELYWLLKAFDNLYQNKNIDHFVFIVPHDKNNEYLHFKNIKVANIDMPSRKIDIPLCGYKLASIVKKHKLDLVNCCVAIPDGLVCLVMKWLTGISYLVTCHGVDVAVDRRFGYGYRLRRTSNLIIRLVLRQASGVTTISQDMKRFAEEAGAVKERIKIIPDGIETTKTDSNHEISLLTQKIKRKYSIRDSRTVYLILSGMRKIKGHENLIRAFAQALKINPNLRLIIGAHGEQTENIKILVKNLNLEDSINFIGYVSGEEKKAWFNISDVYCNTAFFEPFGIVYLEAIKNNLAVLGTIFGGAKDIFEHKKNAYLVNPENIDEITQGIITLSSADFRNDLIRNAKPLLLRYDINHIADLYLDAFVNYAKR